MYQIKQIEFGKGLSGSLFLPYCKRNVRMPATILCHGMGADRECMEKNAMMIAENGIVAFTFDFRGHGMSKGELDDKIYEDVSEAFTFLSKLAYVDKKKICIVGHSLGAFSSVVASERLIEGVFALVILACPWDDMVLDFKLASFIAGASSFFTRIKISRHIIAFIIGMVFKLYMTWNYKKWKARINWEAFLKLFVGNRDRVILNAQKCYKLFVFGLQDAITPYLNYVPAYVQVAEPKQMMLITGSHDSIVDDVGWIRWIIAKLKN
jgi:pimeloyl-ACP methyl ester carboxylesterase